MFGVKRGYIDRASLHISSNEVGISVGIAAQNRPGASLKAAHCVEALLVGEAMPIMPPHSVSTGELFGDVVHHSKE